MSNYFLQKKNCLPKKQIFKFSINYLGFKHLFKLIRITSLLSIL